MIIQKTMKKKFGVQQINNNALRRWIEVAEIESVNIAINELQNKLEMAQQSWNELIKKGQEI